MRSFRAKISKVDDEPSDIVSYETQLADIMRVAEYVHDTLKAHCGHFASNDFPDISDWEFSSIRRAPASVPPGFKINQFYEPIQPVPEYHTRAYPDNELIQIASENWTSLYDIEIRDKLLEQRRMEEDYIMRELQGQDPGAGGIPGNSPNEPAPAPTPYDDGGEDVDSDNEYGEDEWGIDDDEKEGQN